MQTNNAFIKFIQELINRLGEKSPKFWKVLRIIFAIPTVVVAVPEALKLFNVELPQLFNDSLQKVIAGFATAGFITTFFSVKDAEAPQVKEKLPFTKSSSIILIMLAFSFCGNAQSFFKPVASKVKVPTSKIKGIGAMATSTNEPTFWMFRPSLIAATLFIGGTVEAAAGTGIAYQNITQKGDDARNYVNYDIGAYVLAGGSIVNPKQNNADIEKFAIVVTALNGTVGLGYGFSRQENPLTLERKWKGGLALVWKVNLNN